MQHFGGHDIVFECLNEPNGMGHDSAQVIAELCRSAGKFFKASGELFVGPATSGMAWTYLQEAMQHGILDAFGALSVHPYRGSPPDTVLADWTELRALVRAHGVDREQRQMPLISGEWGYTTADSRCSYPNRCDERTQAAYLARMWLANTMAGVAISINYDWSDASHNASACEDHFGSVRPVRQGQPIVPKPMYTAAVTLQDTLGNFEQFDGRVQPMAISPNNISRRDLFVLRFRNRTSGVGFAVWTNGSFVQGQCSADHTSTAPYDWRVNCGYSGIGEAECVADTNPKGPGCCWEPCKKPGACPSGVPPGPQCYRIEVPVAVGEAHVSFNATPAREGDCFAVTDMFGRAASPMPEACVGAGAVLGVSVAVNGTGSGPVYLLPVPQDVVELRDENR